MYSLRTLRTYLTVVSDKIESNKSSLGAAPSARLIVGGISSGGNIANALIYMNRDSGSPIPVAGQFLSVSNIIPPPVVPTKYKKHYQSIDSNQQYAIPPKELVGTFLCMSILCMKMMANCSD